MKPQLHPFGPFGVVLGILVYLLILPPNSLYAQTPTIESISPALANAGASVTITGTNFSPAAADNTVFFGQR